MTSRTIGTVLTGFLALAPLALGGCLGPTYGTGKTQGQMLFDDLNRVASLGEGSNSQDIKYTPRAPLVTPANTTVLPPPQDAPAETGLPESPEARSARVRAEAYQGDGPIPASVASARKEGVSQDYLDQTSTPTLSALSRDHAATTLSPSELRGRGELMKQRIRDSQQGSSTQRKYLSEPPVSYRQPVAGAPVGDPGVPEEEKAKKLEGNDTLFSRLRSLVPSL